MTPTKEPDAWALTAKPGCICRASEPSSPSTAGEVGFTPPPGEGLPLGLQVSLVAFSLPLAVGLPLVLFHLPAQGPKPSPRARPQRGSESRKQAGPTGWRPLGLSPPTPANPLHPRLLFLFCKTEPEFRFYLGEKGGL